MVLGCRTESSVGETPLMPRHSPGMCRAARQAEQSLVDAVKAALPNAAIDLDMPLADACPAIFAPTPADKLALIDAALKALSARCGNATRLEELAADAESLRKPLLDQP